jgi:hypothetical protein
MVDSNTIYSIAIPVGALIVTGLTILISNALSSRPSTYYIGDYLVPQGEGLEPDVVHNDAMYPYDGGRRRKTRGRKTKKRR